MIKSTLYPPPPERTIIGVLACNDRQRLMDRNDPTDTVHEMRQLRLRAVLAEQREADLKAALENAKGERDWWRTIADRRLLPV